VPSDDVAHVREELIARRLAVQGHVFEFGIEGLEVTRWTWRR